MELYKMFLLELVAVKAFGPIPNYQTTFLPFRWIYHHRKAYFWHRDDNNWLISYQIMAISISVVCKADILEIC